MKKALIVGGNSGIGLTLVIHLIFKHNYDHVYITGKDAVIIEEVPEELQITFKEKTSFEKINLINEDYSIYDSIQDIQTLIITAGFGRVAPFEALTEIEIMNLCKCNMLGISIILRKYYDHIKSNNDFNCAIMSSIAGHVASPMFSVYGAAKKGLCALIENLNTELAAQGYQNRILDVSPGKINGTRFHGKRTNIAELEELADNIISFMIKKNTLYIPKYDEIYKDVLQRYHDDPMKFGKQSYQYKLQENIEYGKPQVIVGYLSGTFDLFHIGHLNLLRKAKQECDYLIVGVHKSGLWKNKETFIPYEERVAIINSIRYVNEVVESYTEDSDAYDAYKYDKLFVGSDYKGTERFQRYEEYFKDKNVQIIYFPYTTGTSSTQLREVLLKK